MRVRDVVVVGGGPAGSVAAMLLARDGYDVELLERCELPRAKPCGDCLSPGANGVLRRLGLWDAVLAAQPALLAGWRLDYRSASFTARFDAMTTDAQLQQGIALERAHFDAVLLAAARAAGVVVRTGTRVGHLEQRSGRITGVSARTGDQPLQLRARLVIGADGLRSRVARALFAPARLPRLRKLSLTAHLPDVPGVGLLGEMYLDGRACLGIAPVTSATPRVCNITVVADAASVPAGAGPHRIMREVLLRFGRPDLAHRIGDGTVLLASGPFDWPTRRVVYNGAALVGDAAGYYDPFTGQGIFQAVAGAELLAGHAAAALRQRAVTAASLAPYAADLARLLRPARRLQRIIEAVCARPRLAHASFLQLRRLPELADRLIGVTADLRPPGDLLSPWLLARFIAASSLRAIA